jgi:hypothetical protein
MRPPPSFVFLWRCLAILLLASGAGHAQSPASSPFLPPSAARPAAATTGETPLEFQGVATLGGHLLFRVRDPVRKTGEWLALGQPGGGFIVQRYDPATDSITVEHDGRRVTLTLPKTKVVDGNSRLPGEPPQGSDLVPPRDIRNGIRNHSIPLDQIKPYENTEWYKDFVRQWGPPVYTPPK